MTAETPATQAPQPDPDTRARKRSKKRQRSLIDVVGVFMLSAVAIITAWCGFESSKWGGEMSIAFSQASSARVQATNADGRSRDARMFDLVIWANYVQAVAENKTQLADYIEARFTPDFAAAFKAWDAAGRVEASPFANPAYVPAGTREAAELNATADAKFAQALENNQRGDNYSLLTVLFALVLFLTAMSQRAKVPWANWVLLGLAIAVTLVGAGILATFPIKI